MKTINLLPQPEQKEIKLELIAHQLLNFWFWIIGSMLLLFALSLVTTIRLRASIADTETEIIKSKEALSSAANQQLEKQVVNLNSEIDRVNLLRSQHYHWSNGLIELGNILPTDMVIDLLFLDRASGKVDISGIAKNRESVLKFWSDMHKSKYFQDINFPLPNLERASDTSFSFSFYIKPEQIKQE